MEKMIQIVWLTHEKHKNTIRYKRQQVNMVFVSLSKETEQVCEVISGVLLIHQKVVPSQEVVFVGVFVKQLDLQILSRVVVY